MNQGPTILFISQPFGVERGTWPLWCRDVQPVLGRRKRGSRAGEQGKEEVSEVGCMLLLVFVGCCSSHTWALTVLSWVR